MGDTDLDTEAYEFDDQIKIITANHNQSKNTEIIHAKCIENLDFIKFDWD